jgi:alkylation response protein AidB-like acyl-CoA dehydrogenase
MDPSIPRASETLRPAAEVAFVASRWGFDFDTRPACGHPASEAEEDSMDLSYGSEMEAFRSEVSDFLSKNWPPTGDEGSYSREDQTTRFRQRAIEAGYLCRNIPKKYGGSEQ